MSAPEPTHLVHEPGRAKMAAQAYQVQSVPLIVVDGKFVSNRVASHAAMPPLIETLVAKARAERPKS